MTLEHLDGQHLVFLCSNEASGRALSDETHNRTFSVRNRERKRPKFGEIKYLRPVNRLGTYPITAMCVGASQRTRRVKIHKIKS